MASLTLTIGALDENISADNAKASDVLTKYAAAIGATGTNAEKAQAVLRALVQHMVQEGRRHHSNTAMSAAAAAVQGEVNALTWE
jgi:ABC-type transporter Mla subunit MlaD